MEGLPRPTIRCLREDLDADWEDADVQRQIQVAVTLPRMALSDVPHPLVRHAEVFATGDGDEVQRESISGLKDPPFFKLKTGRWRGAIWIEPRSGQSWLVAAGRRRENDATDFYKWFMAEVEAHGAEGFLPTQDDHDRLALEVAAVHQGRWRKQIYCDVIRAVISAAESGTATLEVAGLEGTRIAVLNVEVERIEAEPDDEPHDVPATVAVYLRVMNWSDDDILRAVQVVACSAIAPCEEEWDVAPEAVSARLMATITEARLAQILASAKISASEVDEVLVDRIAPVTHAHYTSIPGLAEATVEGKAVRALCGAWFVPSHDPSTVPVCATCRSVLQLASSS